MKTTRRKNDSKIRVVPISFRDSGKKRSLTKILVILGIVPISIVFLTASNAIGHTTAYSVSHTNSPSPISPRCNNILDASGKACYAIVSPRLNVPISSSGVTGEVAQPRSESSRQ